MKTMLRRLGLWALVVGLIGLFVWVVSLIWKAPQVFATVIDLSFQLKDPVFASYVGTLVLLFVIGSISILYFLVGIIEGVVPYAIGRLVLLGDPIAIWFAKTTYKEDLERERFWKRVEEVIKRELEKEVRG